MLIRLAAPDDVPAIRALEQQSASAAHWADREYGALFDKDAPARLTLVAIDEADAGNVRGFVIARCAREEWEVENIVVALEDRERGVASAILRELLARASAAGATSVLLEVRDFNVAARRLYEKLGFTLQGRRRNYYPNPAEDAVMFRFLLQFDDKTA